MEDGEIVSIIGPSGSGKSTLLRCATMLETMDSGEIALPWENRQYGAMKVEELNYADKKGFKGDPEPVWSGFSKLQSVSPLILLLKNITDAPNPMCRSGTRKQVYKEARELLKENGSGRQRRRAIHVSSPAVSASV